MKDLDALSNEELARLAGVSLGNQSNPQQDFDAMSNEELARIAGVSLPEKTSMGEEIGRGLALNARGLATGSAGFLDIPFAAGGKISELMASGIDKLTGGNVAEKMRQANQETVLPSQKIGQLIDDFNQGRATPRNEFEQGIQRTAEFLGGAATMNNTALATKTIPELLGVGGAGAASQLAENSDNPIVKMAAPVVGGMTVQGLASIPSAARTISKNALGVDEQAVKQFTEQGIDPNLAAVGGKGAKLAQNALSEVPGSAGVIQKAAEKTLNQVVNKVEQAADDVGYARTPTEAGKAIKSGVSNFETRFSAKADELYQKLDDFIPSAERVKVTNTHAYLNSVKNRFDDLPQLANVFNDPIINKAVSAFDDLATPQVINHPVYGAVNVADDTLKYNTIRNLRSVIGRKLNSATYDGDTRAALKQMYGALSKDMEGAAATKGKDAVQAYKRANSFYAAGSKRIDDIIGDFANKNTPEEAYKLATSGTKEGATNLLKLKRSLKPDEFGQLQSAFIRKMGQAKPNAQNAEGDAFSVNTYLTNWNSLSREAKAVMFGGKNLELMQQMDGLAKTVSKLKDVEKLANTSGTARQVTTAATGAAIFSNPITALGSLAGANVTARMMQSPSFVKWLADAPKFTSKQDLAKHITRLSTIAASNPELRSDVAFYVQNLGSEGQ